MPLFLCRWPNGDCSIVLARSETDAIERLDEVGNAEGCPITRLHGLQVHFSLTEDGELSLSGLGDDARSDIFEFCYPLLDSVLGTDDETAIKGAVAKERERITIDFTAADEPDTEIGKNIKSQLGMPTTLVNKLVDHVSRERLKTVRTRRTRH